MAALPSCAKVLLDGAGQHVLAISDDPGAMRTNSFPTPLFKIDCHVLTMPTDHPQWSADLRQDLDAEPVNQFWIEGIPGKLGAARAAGYALGEAPFLSYADPDDRVIPGVYERLLELLIANPKAPFAWAGEQVVDADLKPIMRQTCGPNTVPRLTSAGRPMCMVSCCTDGS